MANDTFALIGGDSLLGRELRDIASTSTPTLPLRLIAADDEQSGTFTRLGDEPAVVEDLDSESLAAVRGVFLAASSRKTPEILHSGATIIDLTGAAEEQPEARLRAPMIEAADEEDAAPFGRGAAIQVIAHPAAIALALFLRRLHAHHTIRRSVVQILAPASDHGIAGVEELQQQTTSLLTFKSLPRVVFDTQSAFNLLASYGEKAPVSLESSELRIERHLATLLSLPGDGREVPMPSLRLIQAPVFHGYSFSAWVEFDAGFTPEAVESTLVAAAIEVRGADFDPPTNVGQAGQSGIAVGAITPDRNHAGACWFWIVADNLRLSAENAVAAARQIARQSL